MRFLKIVIMLLCAAVILALPAAAADLQGGYYIVADCALGNGIRFYVPASAAEGCFTYDSSGNLFNISNGTVYLYSPSLPDYTISAARFAGFVYRGDNYNSLDLNIHNITETNIQIYTEDPALQDDMDFLELFHVIVEVGCFAIAFLLLLKAGDKHV